MDHHVVQLPFLVTDAQHKHRQLLLAANVGQREGYVRSGG
jgi:hypothetical protein